MLAFFGGLYAKYPRHLLPVTPVLIAFGSRWVLALGEHLVTLLRGVLKTSRLRGAVGSLGALAVASVVLLPATLRATAFTSMSEESHPWVAASKWIVAHVPLGAVIAVEAWDHPLPVDSRAYDLRTLPVFDEETASKWQQMSVALGQSDYIVIASRRGYAALAHWTDRYATTARYYELLFAGQLGFEPVACFERYPRLGPFALCDAPDADLGLVPPARCGSADACVWPRGRLDESFVVYDHPRTIVFRRATAHSDPEEMLRLILIDAGAVDGTRTPVTHVAPDDQECAIMVRY
jgi:hypothetical protein